MDYLLDTHIILWSLLTPKKLSKKVTSLLESDENTIYVSIVSVIEISIKKSIGKLDIDDSYLNILREESFSFLPIEIEDADLLKSLPLIHKDPFDRLIIAQAMNNDLTIITKDSFFKSYDISVLEA